jgi:hypothetical protein
MPQDEQWEFAPGTIVRCQEKRFADGARAPVAISAVA